MILLIDNYDSFAYNVYQLVSSVAKEVKVIRNDECTVEEIQGMHPEAIILSPGPGRPDQAGICLDLIQQCKGKIPILGICLGHQAICQSYGANITYAKELMHGKKKPIVKTVESAFLKDVPWQFMAARYHSLGASEEGFPKELTIIARSDDADAEIMAVADEQNKIYGVQFHPESVMTPDGQTMIENFMEVIQS